MLAVELYRPDELSLYATGNPMVSLSGSSGSVHTPVSINSQPSDIENPYIKEKEKKVFGFAIGGATGRNRSLSQKKS